MLTSNILADDLFNKALCVLNMSTGIGLNANKRIHSILTLTCQEGLNGKQHAFGNLFAQVAYLCREHNIKGRDIIEIQKTRKKSNLSEPISAEDIPYCIKALSIFISRVLNVCIPRELLQKLPIQYKKKELQYHFSNKRIKCLVEKWDENFIYAIAADDGKEIIIDIINDQNKYLKNLLKIGMQLNLLDCVESNGHIRANLIVVEPDFTVDISSIARCFTDYGHNPLAYTVNRMKDVANSQAILLGGFSSTALDDIINKRVVYDWKQSMKTHFQKYVLEYCSCKDLNVKDNFKVAAINQVNNIKQIVDYLFSDKGEGFNKTMAILEPSFICKDLGLIGRTDLMTTDFKLLVEQKSGKNFNIQINRTNEYGSFLLESHYVQLLLYYGILIQNFNLSYDKIDMRLLYSKYPLPNGLISVNFYKKLFHEAIVLRNIIVAYEMDIAERGFGRYIDNITPETLNEKNLSSNFFNKYALPQIRQTTDPIKHLSELEKAYYNRMMTFVYQEEVIGKIGNANGTEGSEADMWNQSTTEKREVGNIYTNLSIKNKERSNPNRGYDIITLKIYDSNEEMFLPNFRCGDMIYLYSYPVDMNPDICSSILYKGSIIEIKTNEITVHLNDGQQNPDIFVIENFKKDNVPTSIWAIEHGGSDIGYTSAIRSLHTFITSTQKCRDLLLTKREPQKDCNKKLSKKYNEDYDEILLKEKQSLDYFLLIGPPGTGKTSMAMRYIVEEELSEECSSILLLAYTNRAVDEICIMLDKAKIDYFRIGNVYSADERFRKHFLENVVADNSKLTDVKQKIAGMRVFVSTTSSIQNHSYLFELKHFTLIVVDEASQILEPNIMGLLTTCRFILIGDYKQLPAVVQQNSNMSAVNDNLLNDICLTNCRDSLFERLIRVERKADRTQFIGILRKQGRMHPEIAEFANKMFYISERLEPVPCPHQIDNLLHYDMPSNDELDEKLKKRRMIFIPSKRIRISDFSDKINLDEARIVADLLRRIYRFTSNHFDYNKTVGVIIPYRNQIAMIRNEITKLNIPELEHVSIDTIERYQGSQRDVIIYSFTVQQRYQLDFLTNNCFTENGKIIDRKLNVAITRARCQMIMIGNPTILVYNDIFKKLMEKYSI